MSHISSSGGTCYEKLHFSVGQNMSGADFSSSVFSNFELGATKHTTKSSICTKGSRVEFDRQVERIATLTLTPCAQLLLLLLLLLPPPLVLLLLLTIFFFFKVLNPNVATWSRIHTTAYVNVSPC